MILFFTEHLSERVNYICHFIFKEQLGIEYRITNDAEEAKQHAYPVICYTSAKLNSDAFHIKPQGLLTETGIKDQEIVCLNTKEYPTFFEQKHGDVSFDVLAAAFYLISRYEEYLPHQKDEYGRFSHTESTAFRNNFLHLPLVNIWITDLSVLLAKKFPELNFFKPAFKCVLTYDIDMAWSYKKKGIIRNLGGFLFKPSIQRWKVLLGMEKDPFDSFSFIDEMNRKSGTDVIYFMLMASRLSRFDKNISPEKKAMKQLINRIVKDYGMGLHPSWKSHKHPSLILKEKKKLEKIAERQVINSRQHYIKMSMPDTYRKLIEAGIQHDFSMGYGSINGFRASMAGSFFWYDLLAETTTSLRLFTFCFMDANSHYEQKSTPEASLKEIEHYLTICKKYNGLFIPVFHNNFLGTDENFKGWKEMYSEFISLLQ
jgi:hypothetical protein